jgi:F1F0 ATPase subunit 2
MSQTVLLLVPFGIGVALGIVYFAGLWHTVKHLPDSRHPDLTQIGSFLLRSAFALTGFILLMNGRWEPVSAALLGFVLAREVLVRRLGRNG